jgi:hypothetical protein
MGSQPIRSLVQGAPQLRHGIVVFALRRAVARERETRLGVAGCGREPLAEQRLPLLAVLAQTKYLAETCIDLGRASPDLQCLAPGGQRLGPLPPRHLDLTQQDVRCGIVGVATNRALDDPARDVGTLLRQCGLGHAQQCSRFARVVPLTAYARQATAHHQTLGVLATLG